MKNLLKVIFVFAILVFVGCGGTEEKKEKAQIQIGSKEKKEVKKESSEHTLASTRIDLTNKGVGPIKDLVLPETIDQAMAAEGAEIYKLKCSACHKPTKKFIGPAPLGVLERRTPAWVMNMILDPEGMVKNDPLAKQLLIEYNGSPMANQSLTEEEARKIVEYFRTIKPE